jgi:DNA replication and repair protein RecF
VILRRLALVDVRSYRALEWRPDAGLNVIAGPNGSGKTNLLEAVALVAGMRLRPLVHESDVVRHGATAMRIAADVEADGDAGSGPHEIVYRLAGHSRRYLRDGNPARPGQEGMPALVAFTPDDLDVVKGGPESRRRLLERDLAQLSLAYRDLLRRYGRALAQRNALLRALAGGAAGEGELSAWDESVARLGASVQRWRGDAIAALAPRVAAAYDRLAARPSELVVAYRPRLALDDRTAPGPVGAGADGEEAAAHQLLTALRGARAAELARGYTLVGPHRDDLGFALGGRDMRGFASQGEQRTAVVAIKLALLEHLGAARSDRPLLVLDDVLSELDEVRQDRLLAAAKGYQTFVTTAAAVPGLEAAVWRTGGGGLTAWRAGG